MCNQLLISTFRDFGFEQSLTDPYVLRLVDSKIDSVSMAMAVHVHDTVIDGNQNDCEEIAKYLRTVFPVNNLGEQTCYTGCSFKPDKERNAIEISQTAFID